MSQSGCIEALSCLLMDVMCKQDSKFMACKSQVLPVVLSPLVLLVVLAHPETQHHF